MSARGSTRGIMCVAGQGAAGSNCHYHGSPGGGRGVTTMAVSCWWSLCCGLGPQLAALQSTRAEASPQHATPAACHAGLPPCLPADCCGSALLGFRSALCSWHNHSSSTAVCQYTSAAVQAVHSHSTPLPAGGARLPPRRCGAIMDCPTGCKFAMVPGCGRLTPRGIRTVHPCS